MEYNCTEECPRYGTTICCFACDIQWACDEACEETSCGTARELAREKERKNMEATITITLELYKELVEKAVRFDILATAAKTNSYLSETEKAIYGKEDK